jgi:hypothetical protein
MLIGTHFPTDTQTRVSTVNAGIIFDFSGGLSFVARIPVTLARKRYINIDSTTLFLIVELVTIIHSV